MRKVFLTFADGSPDYVAARKRLADEARRTGEFDDVFDFGWEDASAEAKKSVLRHEKRGAGYWLWKPDIIHTMLSRIDSGDILVYCDAGCVVNKGRQWKLLFSWLGHVDIIFRRIRTCVFNWTRKELLEAFSGLDSDFGAIHMCYSFEAGVLLIKKTEFTSYLVGRWRRFMIEHPELVRDVVPSKESLSQLPGFIENRHDQSVFSMLVYAALLNKETRNKLGIVRDFHIGLWPFGNEAIVPVRNRSGETYKFTLIQRVKRFLVRTFSHRAQQYVEKHGLCIIQSDGCWRV